MTDTPVRSAPAEPTDRSVPERLRVEPWSDPLVEKLGHDPRGNYAETYWLGILGPSTLWLLRYVRTALSEHPAGVDVDLAAVASALGIGHRGGRNSPLNRAIQRAARVGLARPSGAHRVQMRLALPSLTRAQIARLPSDLQARHDAYQEAQLHERLEDDTLERAKHVALGLIQHGDGVPDAERRLGNWRFDPSTAAAAVRWAWSQHDGPGQR